MIEKHIKEIINKHSNDIDRCITEFLNKQGYHFNTMDELKQLQHQWEKEGKQLRCEIFYKYDCDNMNNLYNCGSIIIPFFDEIPNIITRGEIYKMLKLQDKGYMP